jgi:hypothetical protein
MEIVHVVHVILDLQDHKDRPDLQDHKVPKAIPAHKAPRSYTRAMDISDF